MEDERAFEKEWSDLGELIAQGGERQLTKSDLMAIYDNMDLGNIKPDFLPNELTVGGTASERKETIFSTAQNLWNITADDWLLMEMYKLSDARKESGSNETGGKDRTSDVVSAEILIRIVATAKLAFDDVDGLVTKEAIRALNLVLAEVCAKGRTRMEMVGNRSVYSHLKKAGVMIGTGGGKYLPYPEKSLAMLFRLLRKDAIRHEAYLE
jgi:hypothetical protein